MQGIIAKMVQTHFIKLPFWLHHVEELIEIHEIEFWFPNSESGWQSYAFRKITRWAGLHSGIDGRRADPLDTGRPGLVSNGHQTWSRASTLTQEPMRSLVHHIGSHGSSDKAWTMWPNPTQVKTSSPTKEGKLQTWPNFVPKHIGGKWMWQRD